MAMLGGEQFELSTLPALVSHAQEVTGRPVVWLSRDLLHRELSIGGTRALRIGGWFVLALSPLPPIVRSGVGAGLALWCAACSMAGFLVVLVLTARRPRR